MRFVVYGAGAIGGAIGGRLAQHGHDVVLIARGAHFEALRDHGLRLVDPDTEAAVSVPAVDHPSAIDWKRSSRRPKPKAAATSKPSSTTP